jgi:poly-gamma-glutamate synthesis protein (capsule biosynthesis protein)
MHQRAAWTTHRYLITGLGLLALAIVIAASLVARDRGIFDTAASAGGSADGAGADTTPDTSPVSATASPTTAAPAVAVAPPAPTTTAPRGPLGSGQAVTFAFGGDMHFETHVRTQLDTAASTMLDPLAPLFDGADLRIANLETAITERGTPAAKEFTFRAPPIAFEALLAGGIDVVSMANNHGVDFGVEGLQDSLAAAGTELGVIGIGANADDAYRPYTTTINGQRIAVIGATQVLDDHLIAEWTATDQQGGLASAKEVDRLVAEVEAARSTSDTVIVYLHWGLERAACPTDVQKGLAPVLLDAGADIVVGGHAHRVQGAGRLGEGLVAYGLGNFVWNREDGPSGESGVLLVTATGRRVDSYEWRPARITGGIPRALEGPARDQALAAWNGLRDCTGLSP